MCRFFVPLALALTAFAGSQALAQPQGGGTAVPMAPPPGGPAPLATPSVPSVAPGSVALSPLTLAGAIRTALDNNPEIQVARREIEAAQGQRIQASLAQLVHQLVAFFFDQQQFQAREALADARHHMRQQIRRQGGEDAQPHRACFRVLAAPCGFLHLFHLGHDAARAHGGLAAGRGQHHLARGALHQRHTQLVLEFLDLGGQCRLTDKTRRRGAAEMLVVSQGYQIFQVTQIHVQQPSWR